MGRGGRGAGGGRLRAGGGCGILRGRSKNLEVGFEIVVGGDDAVKSAGGFDVVIHTICADGPSVLTERTDFLTFRKLHMEFWVCGRFDVRDGQIVLWRDYFDFLKFNTALLRGLLGVGLPKLRAKLPSRA